MKKILILLIFPLLIFADCRLETLLPGLSSYPGLDFAIPENFVMVKEKKSKIPNLKDGVYWGEKDEIGKYLVAKNGDLLQGSFGGIIHVKQYDTARLLELNKVSLDKLCKDFEKKEKCKIIEKKRAHWGRYPALSVITEKDDNKVYYVLIAPEEEDGLGLLIGLRCWNHETPRENELKLWNDFLDNTKEMVYSEYLQLNGQKLKRGETLVSFKGSDLKVTAYRRISDDKLKISIEPKSKKISFSPKQSYECLCAFEEFYKQPIVQIKGTIRHKSINSDSLKFMTLNVLIEDVDEFPVSETKTISDEGLKIAHYTIPSLKHF